MSHSEESSSFPSSPGDSQSKSRLSDSTQRGNSTRSGDSSLDSEPGLTEDDATVLATATALSAESFPAGLTPQELSHALKGEMLDHFHLQEFLGGGGMGVVFKALDTTLERIVAVKVLASRSISSEDLQRRFMVEAQSAARLDHPNIARVHFVGRDRGLPYIVIEYIEGSNLRDIVLREGRLSIPDALSYTYQIAHALYHAWQRGVVHRDIKPSNILVTNDGQAKLVDMGLARFRHVDTPEDDLTNTGITLGTFDYISPEQALDPRTADTRSDMYSLGCTLFFMLVGRPPFSSGNPVQKLLQHQGEAPPELRPLRADVPEFVEKLVRKMLSKSPNDRPQSPMELVGGLGDFMLQHGMILPQSVTQVAYEPPPPRWSGLRRHLPWALPAALLLALLMALNIAPEAPRDDFQFPPLQSPASSTPSSEGGPNGTDVVQPMAEDDAEVAEEELSEEQEFSPASSEPRDSAESSLSPRAEINTRPLSGDQSSVALDFDWEELGVTADADSPSVKPAETMLLSPFDDVGEHSTLHIDTPPTLLEEPSR